MASAPLLPEGARTLVWQTTDPNDDTLGYKGYIERLGDTNALACGESLAELLHDRRQSSSGRNLSVQDHGDRRTSNTREMA